MLRSRASKSCRIPSPGRCGTCADQRRQAVPEAADNPFLYRYTRVYIYAAVEVNGYYWYQIGPNQWVHQFKVAKLLPVDKPQEIDTEKWISVDLYEQVAIAYEGISLFSPHWYRRAWRNGQPTRVSFTFMCVSSER